MVQRIDLAGIVEIYAQLDRYNWAENGSWLVIFPEEPLQFHPEAMAADHIQERPGADDTSRVLAIVVGHPSNLAVFERYFSFVPARRKVRLCVSEAEARNWLTESAARKELVQVRGTAWKEARSRRATF